ncbi:MAG TPA: hypothetical protein VNS34_12270 [Rhizobiaceae bacterium]|nr:hypothetical protein [Rhizobiaceae bacterium]
MNTMISLAPRTEQETQWFTTQRVINRMGATAAAINALIGRDGNALDPFLQQSIVLPKVEVLLPDTAPSDYANLAFLLRQVDETLPPFERHVMVQAKIALDASEPWHVGYERARAFARSHFCRRGFPVIMVGHVPSVAGLNGYGSHVHCIVLARPITINGLGGACHRLCSDTGYREARDAWKASLAAEEKGA